LDGQAAPPPPPQTRQGPEGEMKVQVVALVAMTFVAIFAALMRPRA
jgi:hypothetical protein